MPESSSTTDDLPARRLASLDELVWKVSWDARPSTRGRLHAASAFLAPPAALALIVSAKPGRQRVAASVYGIGLCGMFAASGAYHRLTRSRRVYEILRRVDHSMIYVMIAGTWTPVAVAVLSPRWTRPVLTVVWTATSAAVLTKVIRLEDDQRAGSWFYPVLGLAGAVLSRDVVRVGGPSALVALAGGGAAYIGGAIVFAAKRPNPWPAHFGFHEIFHTAVVAGVISHYWAIRRLLRRSPH